jgi:hypothetical protein
MSHSIRLHGPWEWGLVEADTDLFLDAQRVHVPADLGELAPPDATIWLRRRFNTPTGLLETDVVSLELTGLAGEILSLDLNGQPFKCSAEHSQTLVIHPWLRSHNSLTITLRRIENQPVGLLGSAAIVIGTRSSERERANPENANNEPADKNRG